jgi:hypothetical protein
LAGDDQPQGGRPLRVVDRSNREFHGVVIRHGRVVFSVLARVRRGLAARSLYGRWRRGTIGGCTGRVSPYNPNNLL